MSRRYSHEERSAALRQLEANGGNLAATSRQTGITSATLGRWARRQQEERGERRVKRLEQLRDQLAEDAVHLAAAIEAVIDDAPLSQLGDGIGHSC